MIIYQNTRFTKSSDSEYVPGEAITDEGLALVYKQHNGKNLVGLSTGAADEIFAGFSISRSVPPGFLPMVNEGVVEGGSFDLSRIPDQGNLLVKIDGAAVDAANMSVGTSAPAAAGSVVINGSELIFHADDEDKAVFAQYHYEPTVMEARAFHGDGPIGGDPAAEMGRVGLILEADPIQLSTFDGSADWAGAIHPSLGTDGLLTVGGTGTELTNYIVVEGPSSGTPFLTLKRVG